jgi:hypothetical protein
MDIIKLYDNAEEKAIKEFPYLHKSMVWDGENQPKIKIRINDMKDVFYHLNRFNVDAHKLVNEIGGFTENDISELITAYETLKLTDPNIPLPIDSLLNAMALRQKILAAKPEVKNILELGPGSGLSSFLFIEINGLHNYTQIEATQSLYLSQYIINEDTFPIVYDLAIDKFSNNELALSYGLWHIPWWGLEWLREKPIKYDIITANACLNELTEAAFDIYCTLFTEKASKECVFIIQGMGAEFHSNPARTLTKLQNSGWHLIHLENDLERGGIESGTVVNCWLNRSGGVIKKPQKVGKIYAKEELIEAIIK